MGSRRGEVIVLNVQRGWLDRGWRFRFGLGASDAGAPGMHVSHDRGDLLFVVLVHQGCCKAWPGCIAAIVNGFHPCLFHWPSGSATIERHEVLFCFKAIGVESEMQGW